MVQFNEIKLTCKQLLNVAVIWILKRDQEIKLQLQFIYFTEQAKNTFESFALGHSKNM